MDSPVKNKWDLVVKVKYGDMLRRFNICVDGQDIDHDMNKLRTKIINLFKFNANANIVLTYTDIDGDVVTLVDDDELHDAVFRQHLDPLRINVQLKTDSAVRADTSPFLETSSKTGTEGTLTPHLSSVIDDALKSVPDPLRSVLSSISHDFMSKASASAPVFGEFMDYFSKLGQSRDSTTYSSSKSAEFGGVSHVATNPLDHSSDERLKPLHGPVSQNPSSSNSNAVNQIPEHNILPPGSGVITGCIGTSFPENWLECGLKIQKKPSACHAKDKAEGKKVANEETDVKSIAPASVSSADHQPVHQGCYENTIQSIPVVDPPGVTDVLCSDMKNIPCSMSPFISDYGFNSQKSLPVNKHSSEPALSQIASGLPQVLPAYGRPHGHHDIMIQTFHKGVGCNGCGMLPIIGPRFKSNVKEDFDLCSICFSEVDNEAGYTRIDRAPYRSPRFLKEFNHHHSRFHAPSGCRGPRGYGLRPHKGKLESRFIQDVTILDGSLMAPSTPFTKIWKMRNNGTLVWPSGTQLVWIGGDRFAERDSVDLEIPENGFPVDKEIDIAVDFRAPSRPGRYISYWRMASPSGQKFGQRVWVLIQVGTSRSNSAGGIVYPELNLNLPPEGSEQGGIGSFYFNAEPLESGVPSKLDTLGPKDLVPLVNVISNPSNDSPPVLASSNETSPPLPEMPQPLSSYSIIDLRRLFSRTSELAVPPPEEASLGSGPAAGENPVEQTLLMELEEMGFSQIDLNKEVLRLNDYDLEQSLNDLCGISEWDPLLEELQEMGFSDRERNKKLLIKNGGSIKRVVLDLIAGERAE